MLTEIQAKTILNDVCKFCEERNDYDKKQAVIVIVYLDDRVESLCEDDAKNALQLIKYIHSTPKRIYYEGKWIDYEV